MIPDKSTEHISPLNTIYISFNNFNSMVLVHWAIFNLFMIRSFIFPGSLTAGVSNWRTSQFSDFFTFRKKCFPHTSTVMTDATLALLAEFSAFLRIITGVVEAWTVTLRDEAP